MEEIRLLHTSDIHLGAPFEFLGKRGGEQRAALRDAFERITRLAKEGGYQVLVVAGDLFDSAYACAESDVSFAVSCCAAAGKGCQVVILPGSHDCLAPGSVFERERERFEACGSVRILTRERPVVELPGLSLAIHGRALTEPASRESALAGLEPKREYRWNVAVAHGSAGGIAGAGEAAENPIGPEDLPSGFDYVALGHWHSFLAVRGGLPPFVYSGSPEIIARDQRGAGSAVSVVLRRPEPSFEPVRIGKRRVEAASIDCTSIAATEGLVERILAAVPPDGDVILELLLSGVIRAGSTVDVAEALREAGRRYFSIRLAGGEPPREIAREELLLVSEDSIAGVYIRLMLEKIDGASAERKEILAEALQAGYQLFQGRDPFGRAD